MIHPKTARPDDTLARAALNDAERLTPKFSESLHSRIMTRVGKSVPSARSNRQTPNSTAWLIPAAAAAIVLIVLVPLLRLDRGSTVAPGHPDPSKIVGMALNPQSLSMAAVQRPLSQLSSREAALEAELGPAQWTALDHDARLAARLVLDPLPVRSIPPARQPR